MKKILFILLIAMAVGGLLFLPYGWIVASSLLSGYLIITVLYIIKQGKLRNLNMIELVNNRVWDIPIELQCQECRSVVDIDFTLDTQKFVCPSCNQTNKVLIQFITVPDE